MGEAQGRGIGSSRHRSSTESATIAGMPRAATAILSCRQGVDSRSLGDGAVLVDMRTGNCFELNGIGAEIWQLLAPGTTEATICAEMAQRYPVERAVLARDVRTLLQELARHGLVEECIAR